MAVVRTVGPASATAADGRRFGGGGGGGGRGQSEAQEAGGERARTASHERAERGVRPAPGRGAGRGRRPQAVQVRDAADGPHVHRGPARAAGPRPDAGRPGTVRRKRPAGGGGGGGVRLRHRVRRRFSRTVRRRATGLTSEPVIFPFGPPAIASLFCHPKTPLNTIPISIGVRPRRELNPFQHRVHVAYPAVTSGGLNRNSRRKKMSRIRLRNSRSVLISTKNTFLNKFNDFLKKKKHLP